MLSAPLWRGLASLSPARADDLVREGTGCGLICHVFSGTPSEPPAPPRLAATPVGPPSFEPFEDEANASPRARIRKARRAQRVGSGRQSAGIRQDTVRANPAQPDMGAAPAAPVPGPSGPQASQEERRKAAMASEEALSAKVGERARRALGSMCTGCLVRLPASDMASGGRRVEPGAPAEPARRTP